MPIHESGRAEHSIDSGHIEIVMNNGQKVPAYWAHPRIGNKFAGICLIHDWWGLTKVPRLLSNFFAQMGYYVIAPDLFHGQQAHNPREAMKLLETTEHSRYKAVDTALTVLESHHRINSSVALVGIGIGGTLAYEAAIKRDDLEAAISYAGFPQRYLGDFEKANTPICAFYGSNEPYTKSVVIKALQNELATTPLHDDHEVHIVAGAGHDFFTDLPDPNMKDISKQVATTTLAFLERYLEQPQKTVRKPRY